MPARAGAVADRPIRRRHGFEEREGRRTFVKVATDVQPVEDLRREAEILSLLEGRMPRCAAPALLDWNEEEGALRVEAVAGGDLASRIHATGLLEVPAASALGAALAELHREGRAICADLGRARSGPVGVHRPSPGDMRGLSSGAMETIVLLQRSSSLCAHLDRLCVPPAEETLIHGDVRMENVMVDRPPQLRLVNWEFAGTGEGLWDVAHAIAWSLGAWMSSIPQIPGLSPDRLMTEAGLPLAAVSPGLGALWRAYRTGAPRDGDALRRCLDLVAVRLVQLAVEAAGDAEDVRAVSAMELQLAENILERPAALCPRLLGLALDDG